MSVRRLFVTLVIGAFVVLPTAPASALCMVESFDEVLNRSDTAWWGTVTDATVSGPDRPGTWALTVHVEDVLKGPGTEGGSGVVFTSVCGILVSPEAAREQAARFVGQTRLYVGNYQRDGVVAHGEIVEPQGLSPRQQYERALEDLGLSVPVPSTGSAPPEPVPPGPVASGAFPWIAVVAVAAILVAAVAALVVRRRRDEHPPPGQA
jgi:hypothetical protein